MLHIGHFSFDEIDSNKNKRHGYFTCVVEADDELAALQRFKEQIMEMKKYNVTFNKILNIYIEDIIKAAVVPEKAVITRLQSSEGEFPKSISCSLPSMRSDIMMTAFGLTLNVNKHEREEGGGYKESEPFIHFKDIG